jgi:hypothetical protein
MAELPVLGFIVGNSVADANRIRLDLAKAIKVLCRDRGIATSYKSQVSKQWFCKYYVVVSGSVRGQRSVLCWPVSTD